MDHVDHVLIERLRWFLVAMSLSDLPGVVANAAKARGIHADDLLNLLRGGFQSESVLSEESFELLWDLLYGPVGTPRVVGRPRAALLAVMMWDASLNMQSDPNQDYVASAIGELAWLAVSIGSDADVVTLEQYFRELELRRATYVGHAAETPYFRIARSLLLTIAASRMSHAVPEMVETLSSERASPSGRETWIALARGLTIEQSDEWRALLGAATDGVSELDRLVKWLASGL